MAKERLGFVKNPKYRIKSGRGKRAAQKEYNTKDVGLATMGYTLGAYGDLATKELKTSAQILAKQGGYKKLRASDMVAVSSDGRRVLHIATDG